MTPPLKTSVETLAFAVFFVFMIHGVKKVLKLLIGLLLLPLCWAASRTVFELLTSTTPDSSSGWVLPAGFLISVVGFFLLPQAFRTYVLGHELSHALVGLLMGAKVGKMKVGREGGHVELSKSNFIISLAPYLFPFYTTLVIALWYGLGFFWELGDWEPLFLGLVGLTWGFHVTFTLYMLTQEQPDVLQNGRIFSYVVIYLANLLVVSLWMILIGGPTFRGSAELLSAETSTAYLAAWGLVLRAWEALWPLLPSKNQGIVQ